MTASKIKPGTAEELIERTRRLAQDVWTTPGTGLGVRSLATGVEMLCDALESLLVTTDLRSHEPPRNSGEGTAVDGPMPLAGGDDANESA